MLIVAGLEPLEFTNLFPTWHYHRDITNIQKKVSSEWNSESFATIPHGL